MMTEERLTEVTLLFGSNEGDRRGTIEEARRRMGAMGRETGCSSWYETAPWGFEAKTSFYNVAVRYETGWSAEEVLRHIGTTEQALGRTRHEEAGTGKRQYESRPIDIDILFYGEEVIETRELTVPHPRMGERRFVLTPLAELMPGFVHPVTGRTVAEMLAGCEDEGAVERVTFPED